MCDEFDAHILDVWKNFEWKLALCTYVILAMNSSSHVRSLILIISHPEFMPNQVYMEKFDISCDDGILFYEIDTFADDSHISQDTSLTSFIVFSKFSIFTSDLITINAFTWFFLRTILTKIDFISVMVDDGMKKFCVERIVQVYKKNSSKSSTQVGKCFDCGASFCEGKFDLFWEEREWENSTFFESVICFSEFFFLHRSMRSSFHCIIRLTIKNSFSSQWHQWNHRITHSFTHSSHAVSYHQIQQRAL